jgi:capsule polysaccharide modification protein KpsS
VGEIEKKVEEILNPIFLTLNKNNVPSVPVKPKPRITNQYLTKKEGEISLKSKQEIQVEVLSRYKTPLDKI